MNVGDVVQLKSGGPKMTVRVVKKTQVQEKEVFICICQWFNPVHGVDVLNGEFNVEQLDIKQGGKICE